jgi:hypothetical protein
MHFSERYIISQPYSLQRTDAARSIVRLYSEDLWNREQTFARKLARLRLVASYVNREDGETTVVRETERRSFSDFLSAIPLSPLDQGEKSAIEFLKNELAFRSNDDDVSRALRILMSS